MRASGVCALWSLYLMSYGGVVAAPPHASRFGVGRIVAPTDRVF
jgi:hypothetical protein